MAAQESTFLLLSVVLEQVSTEYSDQLDTVDVPSARDMENDRYERLLLLVFWQQQLSRLYCFSSALRQKSVRIGTNLL